MAANRFEEYINEMWPGALDDDHIETVFIQPVDAAAVTVENAMKRSDELARRLYNGAERHSVRRTARCAYYFIQECRMYESGATRTTTNNLIFAMIEWVAVQRAAVECNMPATDIIDMTLVALKQLATRRAA